MIKIVKNNHPFRVLNSARASRNLKNYVMRGSDPQSEIYRGKYPNVINGNEIQEVPIALLKDSHDKCAYCESKTLNPEVEHYRPHGQGGMYNSPATGLSYQGHPGYRWLCYEWRNFLPACHACNTKKNAYFPLKNPSDRAVAVLDAQGNILPDCLDPEKPPLSVEQPLLINPAYTDPALHFSYNALGEIIGLTEEGKVSVELYDLQREDLYSARQEIINTVVQELNKQIMLYRAFAVSFTASLFIEQCKLPFFKIKNRLVPNGEFIGFTQHLLKHADLCIVQELLPLVGMEMDCLRMAYKEVFGECSF